MGLQSRKQTDAIAYAVLKAHNDSRQGAQFAVSVVTGTALTLASGTKTQAVTGANALSNVLLTKTAHTGAPGGAMYKIVPSAGQFIVTAIDTSGATVAADLSVFNWKCETPLFHADQTTQTATGDFTNPAATNLSVTAATPTDLPSCIVSANQMRQVMNLMMADSYAHLVADTVNPLTTALAVDLATSITLANAVKANFNAHLTQTGVHILADSVNTVGTANATVLADLITLLTQLKTSINAHLASAPFGESVALIGA